MKTSCSDRGGEFITGKPESQARNGRFVGYNSKPKGYRKTHWPIKGSRTIARISGEAQSEGERVKVIQASPKNTNSVEEPEAGPKEQQTQQVLTSENDSGAHQSPEPATKIPIYEANPEHLRYPRPTSNQLTCFDHVTPSNLTRFPCSSLPAEIPCFKFALFLFFSSRY